MYGKSLVAQTIAAFSAAVSDTSPKKTGKPQVSSRYQAGETSSDVPDETLSAELLEARTNRDVVRDNDSCQYLRNCSPTPPLTQHYLTFYQLAVVGLGEG